MSTESSPENPVSKDERVQVADDLMCLTCGYNLRGLDRIGGCPECGLSIQHTMASRQGMTRRELATLAFRVVAIWFFMRTALRITSIAQINEHSYRRELLMIITFLILGSVTPMILWWLSPWLSKKAIKQDGPMALNGLLVPKQAMAIACAVIGLLYVVEAVLYFIGILVYVIRNPDWGGGVIENSINAGFELLVGIVFIVGAARIAEFVIWLRSAGVSVTTTTKRGNA